MKKRGMHRRVEVVNITTEKRGMVFRERPTFFMMTPPISIPTATAGRFNEPGNHKQQEELTTRDCCWIKIPWTLTPRSDLDRCSV